MQRGYELTYLALERVGKVMVIQEFRDRSRSLLGLVVGSSSNG